MKTFRVSHLVSHEVKAESQEDAHKKSEQFVRPLIDKDAANDRINWRRIYNIEDSATQP